ncbi:hypothetical protein B0H21DRAFT_815090 [Amylocystis lapponica]|nr:hypothetical protein B0H21DRAFT_815090 [Amylocystis lapponica]
MTLLRVGESEELRAFDSPHQVYPYPCIRRFAFTKLKVSRLPAYNQLLKLGKEREGAIFLDIGCCFGNDIRKAIVDGFPIQNVIGSDLQAGFWDLGHKLFKSTHETFPVPFLAGDAFDPAFLPLSAPFSVSPSTPAPTLSALTTLGPLLGHVSAIHASSFFHLFDEEDQAQLARNLAGLLSPEPGSVIFGMQAGLQEKGFHVGRASERTTPTFRHSPASFAALWDGEVFEKGMVKVDVALKEAEGTARGDTMFWIEWSVTRL